MLNGLTDSEKDFVKTAEKEGYDVLRNGWPDFVLMNGDMIIAVEVKHGFDKLNLAQQKMQDLFTRLNIPYFVVRDGRWPPKLILMMESPLPLLGLTNRHLAVMREAKAFCIAEETEEFQAVYLTAGLGLSQRIVWKICTELVNMGYLTKCKGEGRGSPNLYRFATTPAAQKALSKLFALTEWSPTL